MNIKKSFLLLLTSLTVSCGGSSIADDPKIIISDTRMNPEEGVVVELDDVCKGTLKLSKLDLDKTQKANKVDDLSFKFKNLSDSSLYIYLIKDELGYWVEPPIVDYLFQDQHEYKWMSAIYGPWDVYLPNQKKVELISGETINFRIPYYADFHGVPNRKHKITVKFYKSIDDEKPLGCTISSSFQR